MKTISRRELLAGSVLPQTLMDREESAPSTAEALTTLQRIVDKGVTTEREQRTAIRALATIIVDSFA